jgi:hypothetical protein
MVPQPEFMGVEHRQNPSESNAHVDDAGIETNREHTEIHITIGSVELRAPRAEAKAAAFRPRVTLNDFLNRKRGHRHE